MIAGDGVRDALDDARYSFVELVEGLRLRLYRTALQSSVSQASPVALLSAHHLGLSLGEIMQVLAPPPFWPPAQGPLLPSYVRWVSPSRNLPNGGYCTERLNRRVLRAGGHVQRLDGGGNWIGWCVIADAVEMVACIGHSVTMTGGGKMRVWLPAGLPETVVQALPGRPLRALVDHPVLATGDWTISSVGQTLSGGHVVCVRTGQQSFAAPWPALAAGLMISHAGPSAAARYVREA